MSNYHDINIKQAEISNNILNQETRAETTLSDSPTKSTFFKPKEFAISLDAGKAVPVLMQQVYPGDTYIIKTNAQIRLSAQNSNPLMNINYDINYFFVPYNLIDPEFKNVMGETKQYGYQEDKVNIPQLFMQAEPGDMLKFWYTENDLANYLEIPINVKITQAIQELNLYPFLAYIQICNDWYRDQNLDSEVDQTTCYNQDRTLLLKEYFKLQDKEDYHQSLIFGKGLFPTGKLPDLFTTVLPWAQKGEPVKVPINDFGFIIDTPLNVQGYITKDKERQTRLAYWDVNGNTFNNSYLQTDFAGQLSASLTNSAQIKEAYTAMQTKTGDYVNTSSQSGGIDINDLRYSVVSQHLLELWALAGSRYVEQLKSIWGIEVSDPAIIGRSELIGGTNQQLKYSTIVQTSQTNTDSVLGSLGSNMYNSVDSETIEFTSEQHGLLMGIVTLRTPVNYGGVGLPKIFRYKDMYDFHNPLFNNIGEQPVQNSELSLSESKVHNDLTFGFQEPWYENLYNINNSAGYLSLNSEVSLFPLFLFGEKHKDNQAPQLNAEWIKYNPKMISNTLFDYQGGETADPHKEFYHQFIANFSFDITYVASIPIINTPGIKTI